MTLERQAKRVERAIRTIPVDAIRPKIIANEVNGPGILCLVGGELVYVPSDGGRCETTWDDPIEYAQIVRWIETQPERIHPTHEAAVAFVQGRTTTQT